MGMKLEKHLVLNRYFLNLFGCDEFNELREKLKDTQEGYDHEDQSFFVDVLIGLKPEWEEKLLEYDSAIREYVKELRLNRRQPSFNLKYFQYLAVLFTEIFLDRYYNDGVQFLQELNDFLERINSDNKTQRISAFTEKDLKKLAFWMATGSGKTLIMHINYLQLLKHSTASSGEDFDNWILITPNEGLSRQHHDELKLSGIPCKLYDGNPENLKTNPREMLIIDIHKLKEEKKGAGVSIDVSWFDGKNAVFIDEGHKGQKSEEQKWKRLREQLGENGFVFEYSATFGQVIGNDHELLEEYSKAILLDYSYKYFYTDGHGKDFHVYNIRAGTKIKNKDCYTEEQQQLLLTAALLSFYEQLKIYHEKNENEKEKKILKDYHIEKPLWIFVGSKVTGKGLNSDIVKILRFLAEVTSNPEYLKVNIEKILNGSPDLINHEGNDIFKDMFKVIRKFSIEDITKDIYRMIFGNEGMLELHEIKNADGEIGLKTSSGEKYFGVVNVGDVTSLKKLIKNSHLEVKIDHFSQSLFHGINERTSPINILIGSKKFVEGWNSWRVSTMGLVNMGRGEGPQIIQLFGRGVRLKGKDHSLKREENPDYELKVLQTLFIFGLNADYINTFLSTIAKEEVDYEEIVIPIKFNRKEEWEGKIYTIKTKENFNFMNHPILLELDEDVLKRVRLDLRPRITTTHGLSLGTASAVIDEPMKIKDEYLEILDWDAMYLEMMNYKQEKKMFNLLIKKDVLIRIVSSRKYQVLMNETSDLKIEIEDNRPTLRITSFVGLQRFHEIILMILRAYTSKYYRKMERIIAMSYLEVEPLTVKTHTSLFPKNHEIILKIPRNLTTEITDIVSQLNEYQSVNKAPRPWKDWDSFIVHLDNHLYTPLIIWKQNKEKITSIPVKLNKDETNFVRDLRKFLKKDKKMLENKEIYLLRNPSQRGTSFFLGGGFHPDFIMWIKKREKQHVIFMDSKGIRNLGNFNDEKIQFCASFIKEIEKKVNEELKNNGNAVNLQLDAFILSVSRYDDVKKTFGAGGHSKDEFEAFNIIFLEDDDYISKIFSKIET